MKDKFIKFIKKQWLHVWIVVAFVALISMSGMAAYISTNSTMKRVVVSTQNQGKLFSSNVLVEDGAKDGACTYIPRYFPQISSPPYLVDIYLWNYNITNPSKWYSRDIDYTISFTFTDADGNALAAGDIGASKSVVIKDDNGSDLATLNSSTRQFTKSGHDTLAYNSSTFTEGHYTMTFSGAWNLEEDTDICVKVDVQLYKGGDANKYQDLSPLGGVIGLKQSVTTESAGWQAYIAEHAGDKSVSDCDAYNMVVTGSGKADITFKWDTRYLAFNKNFCEGVIYNFGSNEVVYTAPASGSNIATLVIHADTGSDVTSNRNRYDIQIYKTGSSEPGDWNFITKNESELSSSVWLYVNVNQSD